MPWIKFRLAQIIRRLFYPRNQDEAILPYLRRLYFSRVIQQTASAGPPIRFFNPVNFALDVARYRQVTGAGNVREYLAVEDIPAGIEEMSSRMHWIAGCT